MDNNLITSPDNYRQEHLPPGQHQTDILPALQYANIPSVKLSDWTLKISGLVDKEFSLTMEEFTCLPTVKLICNVHCVETWSILNTRWEGVSSITLKDQVTILPEATYIIIHSVDGYKTNLTMTDFFKDDVLLATKYEGEILSAEYGFPLRLVVPHLYFWKSAKWIKEIEFTDKDQPGYWETRGYHNHGDIWLEERFSAP